MRPQQIYTIWFHYLEIICLKMMSVGYIDVGDGWDKMCWWQILIVGDGLGRLGHQHPLSH